MPNPLVECIPNFSEARRPEVVEQIVSEITNVSGVHILDRHSDLDHNRTVITFVGSPEAVEEAAFKSIKKASELINLDEHVGEHPRIGATDVVPFVPISEVEMADCVEMANRLGVRVGEELNIPVYLYESAATCPERKNLEKIRRGQYETLKEEITTHPERKPDFGPAKLGPAGATVIGARSPLIAFNVYLTTNNVDIAQKIGRAVRHSSGGLRFVKAMGVLVEGRAQVSMNLTNYRKTPVARVVELIRREAQRYGVGIHHSELVGLIPQEALTKAAVWYLQLDGFSSDQVLEQRLYDYLIEKPAQEEEYNFSFLDQLASKEPVPGGGSAAAFNGAAAAALISMVSRVTIGKKRYAEVEERVKEILVSAEDLRTQLTACVQEDANAFDGFMAAIRMPKATPEEKALRAQAMQDASVNAALTPLKTAGLALKVFELANEIAATGNKNAITDAGTAGVMAKTAISGAGLNIRINLQGVDGPQKTAPILKELQGIETQAAALEAQLKTILKERSDLSLF